jgi:hypothetical protein
MISLARFVIAHRWWMLAASAAAGRRRRVRQLPSTPPRKKPGEQRRTAAGRTRGPRQAIPKRPAGQHACRAAARPALSS